MKSSAKLFLFLCLGFLSAPMPAKEIPVTRGIIKSQADAVLVGEVKRTRRLGSLLSIEVTVVEKLFDRKNDVAGVVILSLHQQEASSYFKVGERYVFAASTCENGAHVLLGRQFVAKIKNDYADTGGWHGFGPKTKLSALRSEFAKFKAKDQFLTDHICKMLFDCHLQRKPNKGIT